MLRICALLSVVMLSFALDANADENSGIDFAILDESLADGWRLVGDKGAHSLGLIGGGPVFNGSKAAAIEAQPPTKIINWSLELSATQSVTSSGFIGLRFAFHPGDLAMPARPVFTLYIDGLSIDLARESHRYQLDFANRQWQVVEIPFDVFDLVNNYGTGLRDQVDAVDTIRIESNLTGTFYLDEVCLVAASPLLVLDESLADGWRMVGNKGARPQGLLEDSPVFNGTKAAAIDVKPSSPIINWSLDLLASPSVASQSVAQQGFVGLRFAFHPGDIEAPTRPVFTLYIDGLSLDLARESHLYQLDFTNQQWQIIEIPFEAFDLINYYYGIEPLDQVDIVESIRIEGNLTGTFYIDDVRLLTGTPQISAIPQATSVEALSWGRIKAGFHQ
jgi:hypothetical protein